MSAKNFVDKVRKSIIENNMAIYRDLLNNSDIKETTDKYWQDVLLFYKKLNKSEQELLLKIMKQVSVDTVSNMFAILDGVAFLNEQEDNFKLIINNDKNEQINGDLQDIFLESEL